MTRRPGDREINELRQIHIMSETVFVIDDDISIRRSLTFLLNSYNYTVETYSSAEEFLERDPYTGVGCIVLDINMEGKSGLELQDDLLKLGSYLPIIFITSIDCC